LGGTKIIEGALPPTSLPWLRSCWGDTSNQWNT